MRARAALATALLALCVAVPAAGQQRYAPAVAFDGTTYLVVWEEQRPAASRDIYAARVSEAGVVLDPVGIPISKAAGNQRAPAVAFDGSSFVVVWQDDRSPSTGPDVYAARVSAAGLLLDPGGIPISAAPGAQLEAAITGTGSGSLVVWTEGGAASDIRGARVSSAGAVLDPGGLTVSAGPGAQLDPAVAFGGAGSLVVWEDHRSGSGADLYAARVSSAGAVLDPAGIAVAAGAGDERNAAVAVDGAAFLAAWDVGLGRAGEARQCGGRAARIRPLRGRRGARKPDAPRARLRRGELPRGVARRARPRRRAREPRWRRVRAGLRRSRPHRWPSNARRSPLGRRARSSSGRTGAPAPAGRTSSVRAFRRPAPSSTRPGSRFHRPATYWRRRRASRAARGAARPPGQRPSASARARRARRSSAGSTAAAGGLAARRRPIAASTCGRTGSRYGGATAPGNVDRSPASREWRVDNPIPGLLHVVGGRSRRSGPGPLRRYTVQIEDGIQVDRRKVADTIASILGDRRGWGGTGRALLPARVVRARELPRRAGQPVHREPPVRAADHRRHLLVRHVRPRRSQPACAGGTARPPSTAT